MYKYWSDDAWDDYLCWQRHDPKKLNRLNALIKDAERGPFRGPGKPGALRGDMSGPWSRRIDEENRLVYKVDSDGITATHARIIRVNEP